MKWSEFRNLPNILSISRPLFFLPLTALVVLQLQWMFAGAVIFMIGVATDSLDGWLARKQGQVTITGKLLDPLTDKLFFDPSPLFFYSSLSPFLQNLFVFVYLPLELILMFGGLYAWFAPSQNIFSVGANNGGKWKTGSIVVFTILLFVNESVVTVSEKYLITTLSSATGFALMSLAGHINYRKN
ncbi:MAG: CDP-alcohol phosphatidyltransferase family protein [bacterium]|nr:CDP-alcohol phosphatidyltransferase family protein [bacterium]